MLNDREKRIGARARELWISEGPPARRATEHWITAEHEIDAAQERQDVHANGKALRAFEAAHPSVWFANGGEDT
jgi:hypothetical protein